jgi:hypothetical protein
MLVISKPLSAAQIETYHAEEFSNARDNYYTEGDRIPGQWHGQLARQWGLAGDACEEHIRRLAHGEHPVTAEPLVQQQTARVYTNERGKTVKTLAHRAGWDATFSAPKSVSLTALVGGDARVRREPVDGVLQHRPPAQRQVLFGDLRTHALTQTRRRDQRLRTPGPHVAHAADVAAGRVDAGYLLPGAGRDDAHHQ